jgi:hypothetical protein
VRPRRHRPITHPWACMTILHRRWIVMAVGPTQTRPPLRRSITSTIFPCGTTWNTPASFIGGGGMTSILPGQYRVRRGPQIRTMRPHLARPLSSAPTIRMATTRFSIPTAPSQGRAALSRGTMNVTGSRRETMRRIDGWGAQTNDTRRILEPHREPIWLESLQRSADKDHRDPASDRTGRGGRRHAGRDEAGGRSMTAC